MEITTDLKRYIMKAEKDLGRADVLRDRLKELKIDGFGSEKLFHKQLSEEVACLSYPQISPKFLSLFSYIPIKEDSYLEIVHIPRFGVYSLDNSVMTIYLGYSEGTYFFEVEEPKLPETLTREIVKSSEIFCDTNEPISIAGRYTQGWFSGLREDIEKRYKNIGALKISSTFHGILPTETKEKIREAKEIFGNQIYFVVETKTDDWSISKYAKPRIVEDPLVLGILEEKCFMIDKFNTTKLENWVNMEFSL